MIGLFDPGLQVVNGGLELGEGVGEFGELGESLLGPQVGHMDGFWEGLEDGDQFAVFGVVREHEGNSAGEDVRIVCGLLQFQEGKFSAEVRDVAGVQSPPSGLDVEQVFSGCRCVDDQGGGCAWDRGWILGKRNAGGWIDLWGGWPEGGSGG